SVSDRDLVRVNGRSPGGRRPLPASAPARCRDRSRRAALGAAPGGLVRRPPRLPVRPCRPIPTPCPLPDLERRPVRAEGAATRGGSTRVQRPPPPREPAATDGRGSRRLGGAGTGQ